MSSSNEGFDDFVLQVKKTIREDTETWKKRMKALASSLKAEAAGHVAEEVFVDARRNLDAEMDEMMRSATARVDALVSDLRAEYTDEQLEVAGKRVGHKFLVIVQEHFQSLSVAGEACFLTLV